MKNKKVIGFYNYTVILTYFGMLLSVYGILMAIGDHYFTSINCLILAGICDMFDGTIASTKKRTVQEKRFGIQIDSLSDLIGFGVLPGTFVYMISNRNPVAAVLCSLYILCALIRLAYYNVLEEERQQQTTEKRTSILGVPVTTISFLLPLIYLIHSTYGFQATTLYGSLLLLCGIGFLSPIEIKKPDSIGKVCLTILGIVEALGVFLIGRSFA